MKFLDRPGGPAPRTPQYGPIGRWEGVAAAPRLNPSATGKNGQAAAGQAVGGGRFRGGGGGCGTSFCPGGRCVS